MATRTNVQTQKPKVVPGSFSQVAIPKWRIWMLLIGSMGIVVLITVRLVDLQVLRHSELKTQARTLIDRQITLPSQRGTIADRAGNVLSMDVDRESLWIVPSLIAAEDAPKLALTLSALTGADTDDLLAAMSDTEHYWLRVARWIEPEVAQRIAELDEPGLKLHYEPRRVYPQTDYAAHVIGAVNFNSDGISGVESFYNTQLKGITGTLTAEFDSRQNPIAIAPQQTRPARNGMNLTLTLDPFVQDLAESQLRQAVEQHRADGGTVIIIEPQTGAIRGMASWPPFDPNRYADYPEEIYNRNPAISNIYEPGSTFKIITVAAGLQSRAFTAETLVNDMGSIFRYNEALSNYNGAGHGMINADRVIYYSSNVGALQLNELTGAEQFYKIVRKFGFGAPTGVDLGGEESGIVNVPGSPDYTDITLLTNAYGQGISVTPLQLVRAVAAIANDGLLMTPYIVEQRCEEGTCTVTEPKAAGQAVERGVAWTVRRMLVNSANFYAPVVWASQTGSYADQWLVPGYQVGAKTGTASIPLPGGGYDPSFTIGSVVGFAPAEDARYAVLVKIDRPKDDIWGVQTAIPVFYNIIDQLMRHDRIPPDPALFSPGQQ
jgi:cell division protein FtsI (penicillin-binding protein 3)